MKRMKAIKRVFESPLVMQRFMDVLGKGSAASHVADVLLEVANNPELQQCTPSSIYYAALRAATLRLWKGNDNWYIVPYKGRAVFVLGWRGYYQLALRTGRYRYINVTPVYEGEEVVFDRVTGIPKFEGHKKGDRRLGWYAAFELHSGYYKGFYMSVEEIDAYARQYSASYSNPKSPWTTEKEKMERKTVLKILLRTWGIFEPEVESALARSEEDIIEGEEVPAQPVELEGGVNLDEAVEVVERHIQEDPPKTEEEILSQLGFDI